MEWRSVAGSSSEVPYTEASETMERPSSEITYEVTLQVGASIVAHLAKGGLVDYVVVAGNLLNGLVVPAEGVLVLVFKLTFDISRAIRISLRHGPREFTIARPSALQATF